MRSSESAIVSSYPTSATEWNNCFIKILYQTFDFVYVEVLSIDPCKHCDCILLLTASKAGIIYREQKANQIITNLIFDII